MTAHAPNQARGDLKAPELPQGYSIQPAWGFKLGAEGLLCEFYRVYGPTTLSSAGIPVHTIDQELSYWAVILPPAERRGLTFTAARKLINPRLNFRQFSSMGYMRSRLPDLLLGSVGPKSP